MDVSTYHQGMELPGVAVFRDGANQAEDLVVRSGDEADTLWPKRFRDLLPRHLQRGQPMGKSLHQECRDLIDHARVVGSQLADIESWLLLVRARKETHDTRLPQHHERPKVEPHVQLHPGLN